MLSPLEKMQIKSELVESYDAYAEGIDSKNWPLVRSCFADVIYLDYGDLSVGGPEAPRQADDWVEVLQGAINGFDITRHMITNHRLVIADSSISCKAYLRADHVIFADPDNTNVADGEVATMVGEYTNHYEKIEGAWKIVKSQLLVNWSVGDLAIFERAAERVAAAAK